MKLYEETNKKNKAFRIVKQLKGKPVKIMSPDVMAIKVEMIELIKKNNALSFYFFVIPFFNPLDHLVNQYSILNYMSTFKKAC